MASPERIDARIQELEERIGQHKNQISLLKARKAQADRKADTRRKILAGAIVLNHAQKDPAFAAQLNAWLNEGLTAPRDRALFNLSDNEARPEAAAVQGQETIRNTGGEFSSSER